MDGWLERAMAEVALDLENEVRDQLPPGARVTYTFDEAHDIPDDAWERAAAAVTFRDQLAQAVAEAFDVSLDFLYPAARSDVVEGEWDDVTAQRALNPQEPP